MSTLSHKLVAVCLVAAFSMVMYGCGGGGGSSSVPEVMPEVPEVPEGPTAEEMAAATAAMTAANEAATAANEAATAATDAVSAATLVADTMAASDAAAAATTAAMAATAAAAAVDAANSATVDAANAAATAATMAAMTANTAASDLNTAQADAVAAAAEAAEAERLDMAKAAAERIAGLIGPEPKLADANADTTGNQAIVDLPPVAEDDNFSEPRFSTVASGGTRTAVMFTHTADPAMIDGWTRGTYTHTSEDGMTTHTVVKYNDKAADKDAAYSTFFTTDTAASTTHRAGLGVSAVTANGVLTIANGEVGANHGLFSGDFGPTTEGTYTFPGNAEISGMFRGVPGTFECTDPCASMHDEDGNLSGLTGDWEFEPDGLRDDMGAFLADDSTADPPTTALTDALAAIMVSGVVQDADFMIFGYWEQSVTDDEGDTTETMLPFAEGKRESGAVTDVVGTATYRGPATGLYMRTTLTPQGLVNTDGPYASGQFTADAMLEANFGGGDIGENHQFSVTGTISDFKDGYGADIDVDWGLSLNRTILPGTDGTLGTDDDVTEKNIGAGTGADGTFSGVTHGGVLHSAAGAWSGQFYGPGADNAMPASAGGIFDGHFTNGHVRGAFATNRPAE